MFTNLLSEFFFGGLDSFYEPRQIIRRKEERSDNALKTNVPDYFAYFNTTINKWKEEKGNWYFTITAPDADIRVDEKGVDVSYEISETSEHHSLKQSQKFFVTYPTNSRPETIKARRVGDNIVVTVDKNVIEEDTRRKLTIE